MYDIRQNVYIYYIVQLNTHLRIAIVIPQNMYIPTRDLHEHSITEPLTEANSILGIGKSWRIWLYLFEFKTSNFLNADFMYLYLT